MADVNVNGGGNSNAVLAIVVIALLALLAWFFLRGPAQPAGADIKVDVNPPADAGGAPRPPQ